MAEALAVEVAAIVLGKLRSAVFQEIFSMWGVQDELEKLKDVLMAIQVVLVDAEEQQVNNRQITFWLRKFESACHQVEDLLDEVEIEALRREVPERGSTGSKVHHFFSSLNPLAFRFRMARKIKKAKEMLEEIAATKSKFNLLEKHPVKNVIGERETYSFVNTSNMIGRDEDERNIIHLLMNPSDDEDILVLPIVGIGGIGKTALAQLVFNNERVEKHFESKIWVCVAEDFDIKHLMIQIIKSATGIKCTDMNKEELQNVLQDCLNGKRCFVVLDDVWNEDKSRWNELKDLLRGVSRGSRMIVTTRSHKVATIIGTISHCDLEHLSYENSLSLFLKLVFQESEEKQHKNLVRIAEEIVPKCKGVALAVKTFGSLLCSTRVEHDWKVVRDSELWELEQKENDILPALKLSYDHLPWYLKQCFAFCSIFPKDFEFDSHILIPMWTANGFLQSSNKKEVLGDIGNRYIHELWSRSFFHQLQDMFFMSRFKMHDLVHDLALSVARNEMSSFNHYSTDNVRHLFFDLSWQSASLLRNNMGHLRTLIFRSTEERKADSESLLAECFSKSKHLRVLDLEGCGLDRLPDNIRYLKHLRYLSILGNRNVKQLPNSVCKLQSLETLDFSGCKSIEEMPKDIRNLVSLPRGLKYLISLETLLITDCKKLDLNMDVELVGQEDGSLRKLYIGGLPKAETLPQWIVLGSTKSLQRLKISRLVNLLTLPVWFRHLMSLQKLEL